MSRSAAVSRSSGDAGSGAAPRSAVELAPPPVNTVAGDASNPSIGGVETEADHVLIQRVQAGDKQAFGHLVRRHERRAFALAVGLVRDQEDAGEIVQEAFLRVYRGIHGFNGAASFFTWLYRIVKNLSIDLMRRPAWRRELPESDGVDDETLLSAVLGADPSEVYDRRELAMRLDAAFGALPAYHREVIVMREVEGKSYEEMAATAGVSKGTIMSRLFYARKTLQRALGGCYAERTGRLAGRRRSPR